MKETTRRRMADGIHEETGICEVCGGGRCAGGGSAAGGYCVCEEEVRRGRQFCGAAVRIERGCF